eukprot:gb/GFBE01017775.1/.p1 GENE.gb/GFBE01017775.1/~~gb/GFBE01017775.1/.p1  ORF type:complete len:680 (+),score=138.67 gb/GFBE01017775.1/:1-2040(+)
MQQDLEAEPPELRALCAPERAAELPRSWRWRACTLAAGSAVLVGSGLVASWAARGQVKAPGQDASDRVDELVSLAKLHTRCALVQCGLYAKVSDPREVCDGAATSDACIEKCCGPIECKDFSCQTDAPSGFFARDCNKHKTCQGKANCVDVCCQGSCRHHACSGNYTCKKPFAPRRCTASTCDQQCCYDPKRNCGAGPNAWTAACHKCKSELDWCEEKVGKTRSSVSVREWNREVYQLVKAKKLLPGCEQDTSECCKISSNWKFHEVSSFGLHVTEEAVSVNSADVLADGRHAISGGDDGMIWEWNLENGALKRNFSGHSGPIRSVATFNDATYFCGVCDNEAIAWRLHGTDAGAVGLSLMTASDHAFTACIGLNAWGEAVVGQDNSFAQIWKYSYRGGGPVLQVPVNPKLQFRSQIQRDAAFHHWPKWDKKGILQQAYLKWMYKRYDLETDLDRRLDERDLAVRSWAPNGTGHERALLSTRQGKRRLSNHVTRGMPWTNRFSNILWGDVPDYFYRPDGWGKVTSLAQIPSSPRFAVGYEDGSIRVWTTYNGFIVSVIQCAHDGAVNALVATPAGGRLYSGGADGWIKVWMAESGDAVSVLYAAFGGPVKALAMVPGGNFMFSGHASGKFYIWNLATEDVACHLDTEGGQINSLAVNPARIFMLLVASEDGKARVYQQR